MKVSRCGRAEGPARAGGADHLVKQKRGRAQKKVWGKEQGVELSRLVLGFVRQHKRLPDVGDRGFWQLCHDLLKGAFTHRQVQAKVRYLHFRFRSLAGGTAKTLRISEHQILQIWTHILQLIDSPSHAECPSSPSTQAGLNEMGAEGRNARINPGMNGMGGPVKNGGNSSGGPVKKGANASGGAAPAARYEDPQAEITASTCSTANVDDYQEEFSSDGDFHHDTARGQATSSGSDNEFAHNNAILHHLTVADLAAAVKTLAEIVARGAPKL